MNLTDFLLARIAERAADAVAIQNCEWFHGVESDAEEAVLRLCDPDRVLAECEAQAQIIGACIQVFAMTADGLDSMMARAACRTTLRALALPDADHPDYEEEWKL